MMMMTSAAPRSNALADTGFLHQNLAALPKTPDHEALVEQLLALEPCPQATEAIAVCRTAVGDLSLVFQQVPLHSLEGAQDEATALVKENLLLGQYAINMVLGLGLGYVLKEAVAQSRAQGLQSRLVLFEPNLDLLRFTLENVNLTEVLSHSTLHVFTTGAELSRFCAQRLVKGDGYGFMATQGYLQVFSPLLEPVLNNLSDSTQHTLMNIDLLSKRGRWWSQQFLRNVPYFNQIQPAHQLTNAFKGRTALLCGAGPSLKDELETIKRYRDQVVVFAVTGSTKILVEHGITPDFVCFMDFVGPSKHLLGVEHKLADCQFITGPSAQDVVFTLPHQHTWLPCLHFNEQFSHWVDTLFDQRMPRYHTGGTVSMLMFNVAFDMGFEQLVLIGQDMALRGDQIYADGQRGLIRHGHLFLPETPVSVARAIPVEEVKGWDGETLLTQCDYASFLKQYECVPPLVEKVRPDAQLINTSFGGAFIKGWQHQRLGDVLAQLKTAQEGQEPLAVKETANRLRQEGEAKWPSKMELLQRTQAQLQGLEADVDSLLAQAHKASRSLSALLEGPRSAWEKQSRGYSQHFNTFSEALEEHAFFKDTFYGDQLKIYQHHNPRATTDAEHLSNFKLDAEYLGWMQAMLSELKGVNIAQALAHTASLMEALQTPQPAAVARLAE